MEVDGKTADEKGYTAREGSTVVTLKEDYEAALPAGEHTIGIVLANGTDATTFTVTGDEAPLGMMIGVMIGALALILEVLFLRRRGRREI